MRFKCFLLVIGLALIVGQLFGQSEKGSDTPAPQSSDTKQKKARDKLSEMRAAKTPAPANNEPPMNAEAEFRHWDINEDGLLSYDEMDDGLRAERDRWDTNGDGFIDLEEYRAYFKARARQNRVARRNSRTEAKAQQLSETLGAINQSSDLPEQYRQFDTDHDGQIGLYEWKAAGQPIEKFLELDLNGDGFLTPDELNPPKPPPEEPKEQPKPEPPKDDAEPDPGNLNNYQNQIGKVFKFRVTGAAGGGVWGSGPYTADSSLAVAAVHAGVLQPGQTGVVRVRIAHPPPSFEGSTANGVTTQPFGQFPGAYRVLR